MILIKKIVDGKELYEAISKEEAMKVLNKDNLVFTDEEEKDDFYDELEDLEDELEDLEDELEDLEDELEDLEDEFDTDEKVRIKEDIKNIISKTEKICIKMGKTDAIKNLDNYMNGIGKSINSYKDTTSKSNSKSNRLLNVLPFLNQDDIHELVQDLLNSNESFKEININPFLPFLSSEDCDALFLKALEEENTNYSPEEIAPFVSEKCLSIIVEKYLNGELKVLKLERLYPYLSSSDIKKVFKKILAEKE